MILTHMHVCVFVCVYGKVVCVYGKERVRGVCGERIEERVRGVCVADAQDNLPWALSTYDAKMILTFY